MDILTAVLVGIAVGIIVGALGAGGGILSVPILTFLLGQSPHAATSGSLVIVGVTAIFALPGKMRLKQVRWKEGLIFGALSTAGAAGGKILNAHLPARTLFILFSLLLFVVAALMIKDALRKKDESAAPVKTARPAAQILTLVLAATLTGILTGLFGVGGGFAIVPVLTLVLKLPVRQATATSLVVMIIASLASIITGVATANFEVDWPVVLLFTAGSAAGGLVGGPLSQKAKPQTLSLLFAALLLLVATYTLVSQLI